jgi:magnesium chelatase subunit D
MKTGEAAARLVAEMITRVERGEGYRFGESTVVSRRVHLVSSVRPAEIDVVVDADAGQVFYHRRAEGQVLHLDIFHEVAEIDHREMSKRLVAAVRGCRSLRTARTASTFDAVSLGGRQTADYIDLQTATGGGRITGGLGYGQRVSLRRAHLTHIHVAMPFARLDLPIVPYLIMAAEGEIRRQGRQIRRLEHLNHVSGQGSGGSVDMSSYASMSDSLLRETRRDWSRRVGQFMASDPAYLRSVLDLADEFGGVEELSELLACLSDSPAWAQLHKRLRGRVALNQVLSRLEAERLVESERGLLVLTADGRALGEYIVRHRREIDLRFRLALRKLPFRHTRSRKQIVPTTAVGLDGRGGVSYRRVVAAPAGGWVGALAVPETVVRAAVSAYVERDGPRPSLRIRRADLQVYGRRGLGPLDICLVVDASASMAGPRMRAAKYLAQHLLLSTRDRVAVVVFQEREAYVPFTRSFDLIQGGLGRIRPLGLTPLAEGLLQAAAYVRRERARDPLLLLITDGIPTVPRWSMNPVADAFTAARVLAKEKIRFSCVGLEPNLEFLKDLAAAARGTLHVVGELDQALLSEIAHAERRRVRL